MRPAICGLTTMSLVVTMPVRTSGTGVAFDGAWRRLKAGRTYVKEKTGVIRQQGNVGGESFETIIEIPDEYTPAKKWPLRVQLHGAVGRPPHLGLHPPFTQIR